MPKKAISDKMIQSISSVDKSYEIQDTRCPGLVVCVYPTGNHSFALRRRVNGMGKKFTFGPCSRYTVEEARHWAWSMQRAYDRGGDPLHEEAEKERAVTLRASRTVDWLFEKYMAHEGNSRRSASEKRRMYERDIRPAIGSMCYHDVEHNHLARILQAKVEHAPAMANGLQSFLRRMMRWATTKGRHITDLTADPAAHLMKLGEIRARERTLNNAEIALFMQALDQRGGPFRDPLLMILHTGCRRAEVFGMRWSEIDFERGDFLLPSSRSKNKVELMLGLPPVMIDLLSDAHGRRKRDQQLVWPSRNHPDREMSGFSKITSTLNADMGKLAEPLGMKIDPWSIHDLRRTVVTGMNGLLDEHDRPRIPPHIVERVVNHKLPGLQSVYNRYPYYGEKKAALLAWASHLESLR